MCKALVGFPKGTMSDADVYDTEAARSDADGDGKSSNSELGLNVLLVLLAAGAVIASMLIRKQRMKSLYDEYDDFEEEDLPPPRPQDLDDVDQEE